MGGGLFIGYIYHFKKLILLFLIYKKTYDNILTLHVRRPLHWLHLYLCLLYLLLSFSYYFLHFLIFLI